MFMMQVFGKLPSTSTTTRTIIRQRQSLPRGREKQMFMMRVFGKPPRTRTSTTTRDEKKNDDNLVILLVLEKQKSIILAIIYEVRERGQMIIEKAGEQGQQYNREHRCVAHEKIVTLTGGS